MVVEDWARVGLGRNHFHVEVRGTDGHAARLVWFEKLFATVWKGLQYSSITQHTES